VNSTARFDGFGKGGLSFGMSRVFHRKTHGIVGKSDKKGGRLSNARL
jgi:hypothetical protein